MRPQQKFTSHGRLSNVGKAGTNQRAPANLQPITAQEHTHTHTHTGLPSANCLELLGYGYMRLTV